MSPAPSALTVPAPPVSIGKAEAVARDLFGIDGKAEPLAGERDRNFVLRGGAAAYLLKIVNPADEPAVTAAQTAALRAIEAADPGLPVPRVVTTAAGDPAPLLCLPGEPVCEVRLVTWLEGRPMAGLARSPQLRANLGTVLARLDKALAGCRFPARREPLLWDICEAGRLLPLVSHVEGYERQRLAGPALERFVTEILPRLAPLRRQAIHNDFNPSNILVADDGERVGGIIDFGDMVEAPLVNEVGVAGAYHVEAEGDFLAPLLEFTAAYHAVLPLAPGELALVFDLMLTRMAMTVVISAWRAGLQPENRDYILRNAGRAWTGLERARDLPPGVAEAAFRALG